MKKAIAMAMLTCMILSLVACGGTPAASSAPAASSTPASSAAPNSSEPASSSAAEPAAPADPTEGYPLTYKPKYSMADINAGNKNIVTHQYTGCYDKTVGTTIEYTAVARELESIYKETEIVWPELNDEWKGYKYTDITNTETVSSRTMDVGQYKEKGDKVIKEHIDWLNGIAGTPSSAKEVEVPAGEERVRYSYLKYDKSLTPKELAGIAYEALYLQTWILVPAADQGVCIVTPDGAFTAQMIVDMAAKG